MKTTYKLAFLSLLIPFFSYANNFNQTIKGRVIDENSLHSLPGVSIIVLGSDPILGTTTDIDGYFKIADVPTGRVDLQISFVGYHTQTLNSLNLNTGKELNVWPRDKIFP